MKFKFNILNLATAISFLLSFFVLMFSSLTNILFYPATIMFAISFSLLTAILIKSYIKKNKDDELKDEAIVMELSEINADTYVMQDDETNKEVRRKNRIREFDKLLPVIFSSLAVVLFVYLFINAIIRKSF